MVDTFQVNIAAPKGGQDDLEGEQYRESAIEFVIRAISKKESVTELCRRYGISRQTGHLWLKRYREFGNFAALEDRSHAAVHVWNRSQRKIEELVLQIRRQDGWAGRKIQHILECEHGIRISARTVDRILKREGCIDNE